MQLTVETGPLAGTNIQLERDHPLTIGSGDGCELRIPEAGIARQHAVVKALRDAGFGVKALAPGVRVNGADIEATPLQDGDLLELGATRIRYGTPQEQRGPRIAGFQILGELGRGGMGIVYRAEQQSLHRHVALKVLDKKLLRDPQFVARFVAEARAAAKLSHPNVVPVFDVDHDGELYYYSMELMSGSLETWLKKHGRLEIDHALRVIADAARGLAYAESLGIVHRDIKPDNLMLDQHGNVKIADLGLARTDEDPEEALAGTPHFMAPEQVLRRGVDHRADLYALGCTFYRLITGRTPFRGQTVKDILRAHVKDAPEPPHKVEATIPAEVSAIVLRLIEKEPAARYQSANDLLADVEALLRPAVRKGLWIGLSAAAVLVAGGAIWWAATREAETTIVEKFRDNPEALRLATENEELKARAGEDAATIAFLRARLTGQQGLDLAAALDRVASEHAGTRAGGEATALAQRTREEVASREAAERRRREAAEAALATVQRAVETELGKQDPATALRALGNAAAPADADAEHFARGIAALRERVQTAAAGRLRQLEQAIEEARAAADPEAVIAAADQLQRLAQREGGWPAELMPDRAAIEQRLADARSAAKDMAKAEVAAQWRDYDALLRQPDGPLALVRRGDFAAAAAQLERFAGALGEAPAASRARALAGAMQQAEAGATALAAAAGEGKLSLSIGGEATQQVLRWDRPAGRIVVADGSKKPVKEIALEVAELRADQWRALLAQLPEGNDPARDAAVGLLALGAQAQLARDYLQQVRPGDDNSGTGEAGFQGDALAFDAALRSLPKDGPDWCKALRAELQSAWLLTAGLRAFSERRNLAAASHLERLLDEHAHSLCVTALP